MEEQVKNNQATMMTPGTQVVRGSDWTYGNQVRGLFEQYIFIYHLCHEIN